LQLVILYSCSTIVVGANSLQSGKAYIIQKLIGTTAAVIRHITANDTQVVTVQRLKKYYKRNQAQSPVAALPAVPDPVVAAPVPVPIEPVGHINGQPLWTVDAIVNHRTNHPRVVTQYQVRWSDNSATWEPAQQVAEDVPTMVRQYRRRHRL
jgi:Chromo (CHRromatin Organisation MOdifier) domain